MVVALRSDAPLLCRLRLDNFGDLETWNVLRHWIFQSHLFVLDEPHDGHGSDGLRHGKAPKKCRRSHGSSSLHIRTSHQVHVGNTVPSDDALCEARKDAQRGLPSVAEAVVLQALGVQANLIGRARLQAAQLGQLRWFLRRRLATALARRPWPCRSGSDSCSNCAGSRYGGCHTGTAATRAASPGRSRRRARGAVCLRQTSDPGCQRGSARHDKVPVRRSNATVVCWIVRPVQPRCSAQREEGPDNSHWDHPA
mmetsp:Transcript_55312/g.140580  ORF Transcript_55312/g.140580 Transcript_55312/m.140580 type:complete len:253 (-) Transcript_55312:14-772(-)